MLAQARDWSWVVPVLFVVFWVLSHLWNAFNAAAQKQKQQQQRGERALRPPGQGQQPGAAPPAEPTTQEKLNSEIEEFLKRANERRADKNRRAGQPSQQPAQQASKKPQPKQEASEKKSRRQRESVSQSVEEHLGTGKFEVREQQLTADMARSELQMSQHVQQVFEHRLGSLGESTTEGQPAPAETKAAPPAEQNAEALAAAGLVVNQENLRRAIILREVLERPTDRW